MKLKRILVTGGCGFIGANLLSTLLNNKSEHRITIYDNLSSSSLANLKSILNNTPKKDSVEFIKGDILNYDKFDRALKDKDTLVHLAAHTSVIDSKKFPKTDFRCNNEGVMNALELARKNRIKKFIFASSNAVLGEHLPPINEESRPAPISPYGANKLYGEILCSVYFNTYGLKTVALRFSNVYGPYSDHKNSVVARFIKRVRDGKALEIFGDGSQTRDFIFVGDLVRAIISAMDKDIGGELFHIATEKETRIIELGEEIKRQMKCARSKIIFKEARAGEIKRSYADIAKARKILNFEPSFGLKEGLGETIKYFTDSSR
ncbi:MAG: NAD-dependent epimerase/dehydratase family protein [Candidatus Omnitrophica bacterium]|nr:NAD-dependent epimerase/dehydratase family protein [Candidatus Omnitrophota bacterium]